MTTAVQTQNDVAIAALNGAVGGLTAEEISEELDGATPRYSQVKIPSGGGIAFEVPGEDPESPDIKKDIMHKAKRNIMKEYYMILQEQHPRKRMQQMY